MAEMVNGDDFLYDIGGHFSFCHHFNVWWLRFSVFGGVPGAAQHIAFDDLGCYSFENTACIFRVCSTRLKRSPRLPTSIYLKKFYLFFLLFDNTLVYAIWYFAIVTPCSAEMLNASFIHVHIIGYTKHTLAHPPHRRWTINRYCSSLNLCDQNGILAVVTEASFDCIFSQMPGPGTIPKMDEKRWYMWIEGGGGCEW